jgi:hypothetical protein
VKIPRNIPLAVLALTLALTKASAIGITFAPGSFAQSTISDGVSQSPVKAVFEPVGSSPFSATTSASSGLSVADASWHFLNTSSQAVLIGGNTISAAGAGTTVAIDGSFKFTLFEPVSYFIEGFFFASIAQEGHAIMDADYSRASPDRREFLLKTKFTSISLWWAFSLHLISPSS